MWNEDLKHRPCRENEEGNNATNQRRQDKFASTEFIDGPQPNERKEKVDRRCERGQILKLFLVYIRKVFLIQSTHVKVTCTYKAHLHKGHLQPK